MRIKGMNSQAVIQFAKERGARTVNFKLVDIRGTWQHFSTPIRELEGLGVLVETQHHEVGAPEQAEIDVRFNTSLQTTDNMMLYKYAVKNTARKHGKAATFSPKSVFDDNGSETHIHQCLWKGEHSLFYDPEGYASLSQIARYYVGGLLTHAPASLALVAATTNSYKHLMPGYEAPVNLVFSKSNRSAAVRISLTESSATNHIEFRPPDPTANPYLLCSVNNWT
jgi:glutamine synthetase